MSGNKGAKAPVGDAGDGVDGVAECAGQGHGAWVTESERSGALAPLVVGLVDALEERRADGTALTGTLDHKQTSVDVAGATDELGEVFDAGEDVEVGGFVDHGLDA